MDLLIIAILTVVTLPVVILTDGVPRVILGLIFLIVSPGYSLISALFPRKEGIKGIERAALSLGLSLVCVALSALVLNYLPWGISLNPVVISLSIIIYLLVGIALFRRWRVPEYDRFLIKIKMPRLNWGSTSKFEKILSLVLVLAVIGAIAASVYFLTKPGVEEPFTDFYILGSEGEMGDYPREVFLGDTVEVTIGIENHEQAPVGYRLMAAIDEEEIAGIESIELGSDEKWSDEISFSPLKAGENQLVEFTLYKDNETDPYRKLHFWLDVKTPAGPET